MIKVLFGLFTLILIASCDKKPFYVANIGNSGSLDGPYVIKRVSISDILGGRTGFGYGAVNGYPGASVDIVRIGVPKSITGFWAKQNPNAKGYVTFYRISADINSDMAEQKIRTLQGYYQKFNKLANKGHIQVVVEKERIRVLYTQGCYAYRMNCSPRKNADPNGWVVRSPTNTTDVVILFDGKGETSTAPFPNSPYDK